MQSYKEKLKQLKPDKKTKLFPSLGSIPMDPTSQEQTDTPIAQAFTVFPNLPLELQRKIWEFAAVPISRAIEIQSKYKKKTNKHITSFYEAFNIQRGVRYYTTTSPIPTNLLHTCIESRNIALRSYNFRTFFRRPFYINEDLDIFWVRGPAVIGFPSKNDSIIIHCPREKGKLHNLISEHKFRHLAIDYQAARDPFPMWTSFFPGQRNRSWNMCFWRDYILESPAIEKIYLVYTKLEEREMAREEAKNMSELGKDFMEKREKDVAVIIPGVYKWYCKASELRRRHGLGFKVPSVEAILDTEFIQNSH
ncbi:hypothetical protein BCIN_06g05480 [Botrytis cinerea B05.10]|uniref:2EXR domain-containing protein n=1 Tax=Botryotinia fuckeliana (strain B05.10) TaxID=332648 RepID=A0A384JL70_BOTFB|nr:hypothetical protein BCIN_06g05480 [Botrytis cinerea B05.10]ATZ51114.1 hypothetical protein BCIN_06g05480 [Botrytis cinerea B05.10]